MNKFKKAKKEIPNHLGVPEMMPITTGLGEIYQYVLKVEKGYSYPLYELRSIQDWIVKRRLSGVGGVIEVSSFGGKLKQYEVSVNPDHMNSVGVTLPQVYEALSKNNENAGAGYIEKNANAYYIRTEGLINSEEDIESITIANNGGVPILIRDIATVKIGTPTRFGAMTKDGEGETVGGIVLMYKGENSSQVVQNVKERIAKIQRSLPKGVSIEPYIDRSDLVNRTTSTVITNLAEGALIVIFILVLLLGNIRAGIIIASVIPLSLLFAIGMMNLFGVSANLMSLGAIDFGIVADGTIILVEAIIHHLYVGKTKTLTQRQMDKAVFISSSKIRKSAAFGEIIILIVYLPLLSLVGIEGKMFKPMSQTVSFAILGALILSLTYVPMVSALFLDKRVKIRTTLADKIIAKFKQVYKPILLSSLRHKSKIIVGACIAFTIALLGFFKMGGEFIPTLEEGDMALQVSAMPGTSLSKSIQITTKIEKLLKKKFPEIKSVVSKIGASEIPTDPMGIENYDIMIIMKDKSQWVTAHNRIDLVNKMKHELENIVGVNIEITQPIQLRFNELISGVKSDIGIKIYGENSDTLLHYAQKIEKLIQGIPGIADMKVEQTSGLQQYVLKYDRDKMAQYGVNISEINDIIKTAHYGKIAGTIFEQEKKYDLVVRLNKKDRENLDLTNLFIKKGRTYLPVGEFVDFYLKEGPLQISRENTRRKINIGINVRNRDVESLVNEIRDKLSEKLELPTGYYVDYGGQFQNLIEAKERLSIAVPIALLLILFLLYITFGSIKCTLLIFTAVPLSSIGGVMALYLRNMPFSISAGIGFIALFGVAVLNGIVLISYFNRLREENPDWTVKKVVIHGALDRLRPVVITASVASFGFLPMALSSSAGAEVQKPLATVVIGGLITATFLTLLVIPCLYMLLNQLKPKIPSKTTLIVALIFAGLLSNAQNEDGEMVLTIDNALEYVHSRNTDWKNMNLQHQKILSKKGSMISIGDTEVFYRREPDSPTQTANIYGIKQNFGLLHTHIARIGYINANIRWSTLELKKKLKTLETFAMLLYNDWHYCFIIKDLALKKANVFKTSLDIAKKKYDQKSISLLDYNLAKMKSIEAKAEFSKVQKQYNEVTTQIKKLLKITQNIVPKEKTLKKIEFVIPKNSTIDSTLKSPLDEKVNLAEQKYNLEYSKLFPSVYLAYMNINGRSDKPLHGIKLGINIPLWFLPKMSKNSQMKLQVEKVKNQVAQEYFDLEREYEKAKIDFAYFSEQTQNFQGDIIEESQKYLEQINMSYKTGNISMYEYIQGLSTYYNFMLKYNEVVKDYNRSVINLKYFY